MKIEQKIADLETKLAYNMRDLSDDFYDKYGRHHTYKNYQPLDMGPYDDARVVFANHKASIWVYFGYSGEHEIMVTVFTTGQDALEPPGDINVDALQDTREEEVKMKANPKTTPEDIFNWLKPLLDKYA